MKRRLMKLAGAGQRRPWLWLCMIVLAVLTLSAGIWFGYGPYPGYDSDGDGLPDWLEQLLKLDHLGTNDRDGDLDDDDIPNWRDTSYGPLPIRTAYPARGERLP
mgnify:CR=1 FL=1